MQGVNESMKMIEVKALCRDYAIEKQEGKSRVFGKRSHRKIHAVSDLSFDIEKGETVGFIGPNGAGKSTTIKMLVGILNPTGGSVTVLGKEPYKYRKENAEHIGVVFGQKSQLWWDLPVIDTYKLLKKIYKIPDTVYRQNLESYTEYLQMKEFLYQPVRQLSLGQRMRAELCAALLHDPEILFLDEPTIGLDIVVKKQIREMIRKINRERKATILLTTHDLQDIEEICERIILINHGKMIVDGQLEEVRENFRGFHSIEFMCTIPFQNDIVLPGVDSWVVHPDSFTALYQNQHIPPAEIIETVLNKYPVKDIKMKQPTIEEIVEKYYLP